MAIRLVRKDGDEVLRKKARPVEQIDKKIITLLEDMEETMRHENGVGLAAPQVGVLRRVVVIDVGEGLIELINPEIVWTEGKQLNVEGCLSIPGKMGEVERPAEILVRALNRKGEEIEIKGSELLAVALSHEIDHLDGVLFTDKVIRFVEPEEK